MKKILIIISLAVLASFRLSAKASGFTSGNLVYNIVSEDELTCEAGGLSAPAAGKGLLIRNDKKYICR